MAALLACPECGHALHASDRSLRCANGHSFDLARQGYVGLLTGASTKMTGDTPAMLDARAAFQRTGHFAPIATAATRALLGPFAPPEDTPRSAASSGTDHNTRPVDAQLVTTTRPEDTTRAQGTTRPDAGPGPTGSERYARAAQSPGDWPQSTPVERTTRPTGAVFLEVGAGTGYYLAEALDASTDTLGIALDVAKPAVRRAARAHPRMASILADAWRGLPIRDGVLSGVLSVFAPRNPAEVARALAPGGRFVVVTPTARHLGELVGPLGMVRVDPDKDRRLAESLADTFTRVEHTLVEFPMKLSRTDVTNVIAMGPSAFHGTPTDDPRIAALPDTTEVTASVTVSTYLPNPQLDS